MSRCSERDGLDPVAVDEQLIERLVDEFHRAGKAMRFTPRSFRLVLGFLRSRGIVPAAALDSLLGDFQHCLVAQPCLTPLTVRAYRRRPPGSWPWPVGATSTRWPP